MSIVHMSNRTSSIEVQYLNSIIGTYKSYFTENYISDFCESLLFIDGEKPDILYSSLFEEDENSSLMSFSDIRIRSCIFFYKVSSLGIDNRSCLKKSITRIYQRFMIINIWHDTNSVSILAEEMCHLTIIKHWWSIALAIECEKSSMVYRTFNFVEVPSIDESTIFFCIIMPLESWRIKWFIEEIKSILRMSPDGRSEFIIYTILLVKRLNARNMACEILYEIETIKYLYILLANEIILQIYQSSVELINEGFPFF